MRYLRRAVRDVWDSFFGPDLMCCRACGSIEKLHPFHPSICYPCWDKLTDTNQNLQREERGQQQHAGGKAQ